MRQTAYLARIVTIRFVVVTLLCVSFAQAGDDPKDGKTIYEKHCVHCHGLQGKGDGSMGRLLRPPATDFHRLASWKRPAASLRQAIENGRAGVGMAPWKEQLKDSAIADVRVWLAMLRQ